MAIITNIESQMNHSVYKYNVRAYTYTYTQYGLVGNGGGGGDVENVAEYTHARAPGIQWKRGGGRPCANWVRISRSWSAIIELCDSRDADENIISHCLSGCQPCIIHIIRKTGAERKGVRESPYIRPSDRCRRRRPCHGVVFCFRCRGRPPARRFEMIFFFN